MNAILQKRLMWAALLLPVLIFCLQSKPLAAQEASAVKGGLGGVISDNSGAVIPGAKVTLAGAADQRTTTTDSTGHYQIIGLTPGLYTVTVEKEGFKVTQAKKIEVVISRVSSLDLSLQPGAVAETVQVQANSVEVDTTTTALGDNLSETFYQQVPIARNVGSLFYVAPGAVNSGGTGSSNPSIGGSTGLENQYIVDGVNLTDVGYGGLGTFSPTYGSLGTGINLSFIQGIQVKTGAFEPKYGKANGGVVLIVTKSGGNQFHGALSAYFAPDAFTAGQRYADNYFNRVNVHGRIFSEPQFDAAVELGGYIPVGELKDKLFFFGAFNPSLNQYSYIAPNGAGLAAHGPFTNSITTYNWAGKLTYKATDNVIFEASAFSDPSSTNLGYGFVNSDTFPAFPNINLANKSAFSRWDYGSRSEVARMNATISPTWILNMAATAKQSHFTEYGFKNDYQIVDYTQTALGVGAQFTAQGLGFYQNPDTHAYSFSIDTQKTANFFGSHSLSVGWEFDRAIYDLLKGYSGGTYAFPATNNAGTAVTDIGAPAGIVGTSTSATFKLEPVRPGVDAACPKCPTMNVPGYGPIQVYLQQNRGIWSNPQAFTSVGYHSLYANDDWSINRHVTINAGIRWDEEQMNGVVQQYVFNDNWSPRLGINYDPFGDRKSKIFFNFGRYTQALPADAAVRELNQELDVYRANYAPASDSSGNVILNSNGTVTVVPDAAHLLSGDTAGAGATVGKNLSISGSGFAELIAPGTKLNYEEEFVGGIEHQFGSGFVLSVRYTDRRLLRIVEDMSGASPEGANSGFVAQNFLIGNPSASSDYFVNEQEVKYDTTPPANCPYDYGIQYDSQGNPVGGACGFNADVAGNPFPDGKPDGFANPRRHYQALEVEMNKNFSHNFLLRANYRYAKLFGNYEGLYRNDNGQSDPGISSLFDFTQGVLGLLGDQFKPGYLNTDRRQVGNLYGSYMIPSGFMKNLTAGIGWRGESGQPISKLGAHPVYDNGGEIPLGGRGTVGRVASNMQIDLHADYPVTIRETNKLKFAWDVFNVLNSRSLTAIDQFSDLSYGNPNQDYLKPQSFQRAFYARGSIRFEF